MLFLARPADHYLVRHPHLVSRRQDSDSDHCDDFVSGRQAYIAWVAGHDGDLIVVR
jgi:hypothetical protein